MSKTLQVVSAHDRLREMPLAVLQCRQWRRHSWPDEPEMEVTRWWRDKVRELTLTMTCKRLCGVVRTEVWVRNGVDRFERVDKPDYDYPDGYLSKKRAGVELEPLDADVLRWAMVERWLPQLAKAS